MAGEINVDAMLCRITPKQFMMWDAYAQLEPFGDTRSDWHAASIREMLFNMAVKPELQRPMKDFLIEFKDVGEIPIRQHQTWQQKKQIVMAIALAHSVAAKDL